MKKYLLILSLLFITANCWGSTASLSVELTVNPVFQVDINNSSIDLGNAVPPSNMWVNWPLNESDLGLQVSCKTNHNKDWQVNIEAINDFIHEDGYTSFPASKLQWMCVYTEDQNGTNLNYATTTFAPLTTTGETIYSSLLKSSIALNGLKKFKLIFGLDVPQNSKAGKYTTSLRLTMTE